MNPFAPRTYGSLLRVTDRVYIFRNIVNSAIVFGDDAIAVIDTQVNESSARRLLQQIRDMSDKPVRYAINTHYHWDHTGGNHVFKDAGATVLSSAKTYEFIQLRTPRQKAFLLSRGFELGPDPYLADETIAQPRELELGNQRLCLQHLGSAESDDAMAIHLPQERCVVAGDTVMTGSFPIFGQPVMNEGLMGSAEWLKTISAIERLQAEHVLPGHGPVAYEQEIELLKRIEQFFLDQVASRVARQMPLPALLADLESQLPDWITNIPVTWGTPRYAILRVYRGLVDEPQGEPGWQHMKPSAIPAGDGKKVDAACTALTDVQGLHEVARQFEEGGDLGSAVLVARRATTVLPEQSAAWVFLAELLVRGSRQVASVLEKGDFFFEAQAALQRALQVAPQDLSAHLALGRFDVMRAYRNGDDPTSGLAHLHQVIDHVDTPPVAQGPSRALLAQAHFYIGMGQRTVGDERQAMASFQTALDYLPTFEPARLAQQAAA
jgi:glyoxylase-like metal-dependent hydrolase (beta-lactamase superfamily II)